MSDYKRVPTSAEVWAVILARHPELRVFSGYSDPSNGKMVTSYGFACGDIPMLEAQTTWIIDPENPSNRNNKQHEYWLCVPIKSD